MFECLRDTGYLRWLACCVRIPGMDVIEWLYNEQMGADEKVGYLMMLRMRQDGCMR
jgi:hypothetical protein